MNFVAQGLHKTWPHGIVKTALIVLVRFLSQAGQILVGGSVRVFVFETVLKLMAINDLSERLCLVSGEDVGHSGDSLIDFVS